jgi:hypothetical protein
MENAPQLGQLIENGDRRRDAVHIAVVPITAETELIPGQAVGLSRLNDFEFAGVSEKPIGIVDPFLTAPVQAGQRFWLCLYPGTITSLRHVWTHPEFSAVAQNILHQLPA